MSWRGDKRERKRKRKRKRGEERERRREGEGERELIALLGATSILLATHPFNIVTDDTSTFVFAGAGGHPAADGVSLLSSFIPLPFVLSFLFCFSFLFSLFFFFLVNLKSRTDKKDSCQLRTNR